MVTINARYGFKEPRRRFVDRSGDPLYNAFEKWLGSSRQITTTREAERLYMSAIEAVRNVEGIKTRSPDEINSLVLVYQHYPMIQTAGFFLSACYNEIETANILFNVETDEPLEGVGYQFNKSKRLVLIQDTGNFTAYQSNGNVMNFCKIRNRGSFGKKSHGTVINYGECASMTNAHEGISINMGKAETQSYSASGLTINLGNPDAMIGIGDVIEFALKEGDNKIIHKHDISKNPELEKYLDSLKKELESYRNRPFPECLGAFDVVEREMGDRKEFEKRVLEMMRNGRASFGQGGLIGTIIQI